MPELPEVETIARKLRPELVGRIILSADLRWARTLASPTPRKFKALVQGQQIQEVGRRAMFLILRLTDFHLLIHLRMSGDLALRGSIIRPELHDRLVLQLSGSRSHAFNDTRKFGRIWMTSRPEEVLGRLGPEPLGTDFTVEWLHAALQKRHRQLKPLLMDQSFLAGLGNIYTDEALHIARLHPLTLSSSVTETQAGVLHAAIRSVLQEGIRRNGASFDWVYRGGEFQNYFRVYDRKDQACPVCGTKIERILVGQRGTHYCPRCQVR